MMPMLFTANKNKLPSPKKPDGTRARVFVGMSGGVDSSVSAVLLKKAGFDVTGVHIEVYHPPELECNWRDERLDAIKVCEKIGIPFLDCDLQAEYKKDVFDYMVETYKKGETPNPDVFCNKYVKFGGFLDFALKNGADYIATGHYAQHQFSKEDADEMLKGVDHNKDQTYFLWTMPQEKLQKVLFPIGHLEKKKVRKLAEKYDLHNQNKKDSQGICFLGHVDIKEFLAEHVRQEPGKVLNTNGTVIGTHPGVLSFTIGERHGFSIDPAHKTPDMPKLFVVSKDIEKNTITVGSKDILEKQSEQNTVLTLEQCNWISGNPDPNKKYQGRIRYRGTLLPCTLVAGPVGTWQAQFETPHAAVAAGQSAVFYDDDVCIGGGVIAATK